MDALPRAAPSEPSEPGRWVGQSVPRVEDAALLTGRARFIDDLGTPPGTLHAAIVRSPHAHALVASVDTARARALPGVAAVLTGAELRALSASLVVGVKAPIECWPIAIDRVRYVGEPVAVVVARDRYIAEDAADLTEVDYERLPAIVDPVAALASDAPVLHDGLGGNLASDRRFRFGDPESEFAAAAHRIAIDVQYPRNACTPIETYGVLAEYDPGNDAYDVLANFQGPFSIHAVIARALKVPGNRLRLRTPPESGGSFGVKQGVFPYIVLMALAARVARAPVKWIEDRLEHLAASSCATNRVTHLAAAVTGDGRVTALDWDQIEDCGAHLRAPEPATLYRMHGNMTGAYAVRNVAIRNRVVLTNKMPTGLNRGFGGPQVYFALERLMQRIAVELGLDPLDVIRRNLVPADAFPYRSATGAVLDSGDYQAAVADALDRGEFAGLLRRRDAARAEGRVYGVGFATVVEPSVSNMGYITAVLTPAERRRAGPKNGAQATATVQIDPVGAVSVHVASVPQGQGHRTVIAQVVADVFGLSPAEVRVITEMDTARDAWSIASGNYSSRFAPAVAGAAHLAAMRLRHRLARAAAAALNILEADVVFAEGRVCARGNPDNAIPFGRLAATGHWAPATLPAGEEAAPRETVFWTPPELAAPTEADEVNSSLCHGFIFDIAGVEVDRDDGDGAYRPLRYDARLWPHPASRDGRGPGERRLRARARCGTARGMRLRGGWRPALRHFRRLSRADRGGRARAAHPAPRDRLAVHAARREGRGRGQLHVDARLHCERGRRRTRNCRRHLAADARAPGTASARGGERATPPRRTEADRRPRVDGRGQRAHRRSARARLGGAARPRGACLAHPRRARRAQAVGHAVSCRGNARRRPGARPLPGGGRTLRSRSAECGDAARLGGGRPRFRPR